MKFRRRKVGSGYLYVFYCPGCQTTHTFDVRQGEWEFDGDWKNPTFNPSLNLPEKGCHLFVRNGQIQYLNDCRHYLVGKTIDMPDME